MILTPIYKNSDKKTPVNYREISGNIFSKVLLSRMQDKRNNAITVNVIVRQIIEKAKE